MLKVVSLTAIRNTPLFSGLTEQDKDALIQGGHIRRCPRGQMLFHHGDKITHFYIIIDGTIQLFRENAEGQEKTLDIFKSGKTLCESEVLDGGSVHRANAKAVEDTTLLEFTAPWLKENAKKYGAFALNLLSLISDQAHLAEVEAEHQANMTAAQLVGCFLQRLCTIYDFDPKGFDLPYSKTLIASRLGMELETLSRTLTKLKDHGITVRGTRVSISNADLAGEYICAFCSISGECPTHSAVEKKVVVA